VHVPGVATERKGREGKGMGEGRKGRACLGLVFTGEVSTRIRRRGWCGGVLPPGEEREQEGRDLGLGR
jgi:hypothetical protein